MTDIEKGKFKIPPTDYAVAKAKEQFYAAMEELANSAIILDGEKMRNGDLTEFKKYINYLAELQGKPPYTDEEVLELIRRTGYFNI